MTTQVLSIPSMIRPAAIIPQEVLYLPILSFGHIRYTAEREMGRLREAELVSDMLDAQLTDVARIIAIDEAAGSCWDATREIADCIFTHLIRSGSNIPEWLIDFLEAHIATNELAPYLNRLAA